MADHAPDWFDVLERLDGGDRQAFLELSRLISSVLRGLRAYDFQDDWGDVIQDVSMSLLGAFRDGRIARDDAVGAYARQAVRNRFRDRLRGFERRRERDTVDIAEPAAEASLADPRAATTQPDQGLDLRRALDRLPEIQRNLVWAVYGERRTYEEAAERAGVPLGSAKRHLAEGLRRLRGRLAGEPAP